ncbi:MAG: MBL fold metallo-hydrolase [Nitrososphaerota archaeon]|jgi:glyoxylase-like metal-dependent hydrolase (beta-lactamase superfamily II)|nr:MBL fold metallo-hydrolase [Nitrososphaerota archaeon]MDG6931403.1 MBL fold metallo-hydrolase [Nitrososphaerota archaeon]MDG6936799.1 MBL fold metallo-hydrolase [Nitrososphaerota archaeon]MDG6943655.1 MBL fold metallo-hydrolase [Nitrososphaerota archaeon]
MASSDYAVYRIPIDSVNANSYFVRRGNEGIIIDAGMPGNVRKICGFLKKCDLIKVNGIILTHYHVDHAGSAAGLKRATKAPIFIHEEDEPYITGEKEPKHLDLMPKDMKKAYLKYGAVTVDRKLRDNDSVFGFRVIHLPGHTPGSIALYDGKSLFSGDSLSVIDGKVQGSFGAYDDDREGMLNGMKKLLELDYEILLPGHGSPLENAASGSE